MKSEFYCFWDECKRFTDSRKKTETTSDQYMDDHLHVSLIVNH